MDLNEETTMKQGKVLPALREVVVWEASVRPLTSQPTNYLQLDCELSPCFPVFGRGIY